MRHKKNIINFLGYPLDLLGVDWPVLNAEKLLQEAREKTGYNDFGDMGFKTNLERLLESAKKEANLTTFGKLALYHESIGYLCSRLALHNEFGNNPKTLQIDIKRPLFITGLPRTGTTILQTLLAQDPQFRAPLTWEYNLWPKPPENLRGENQKRIDQSKADIENFKSLVPNLTGMHPLEAELPEECIMGMAISFDSILFELKYHVPSYRKWCDQNDKSVPYREHKMILQYLQKNTPTKKWLLKTPAHIANLPYLIETYPDAMIVQTHRDVKKSIPSMASMGYNVRKAFGKKTDKKQIGEEAVDTWSKRLDKGLAYRSNLPEKTSRFFDLDFADLMKNPMGSIKKIYGYFDLQLTKNTLQRMESFLKNNPRGKRGSHNYSLKEFGLSRDCLDRVFQQYNDRFVSHEKNYD